MINASIERTIDYFTAIEKEREAKVDKDYNILDTGNFTHDDLSKLIGHRRQYSIYRKIRELTLSINEPKAIFDKKLEDVRKQFLDSEIIFNEDSYSVEIRDKQGVLPFNILCSNTRPLNLPSSKNILEHIFIKGGSCHVLSLWIAIESKFDCVLMTGEVYCRTYNEFVLHSIIEYEKDGTIYVIDPAANIVMRKDLYYFFREYKEMCRIDKATLLEYEWICITLQETKVLASCFDMIVAEMNIKHSEMIKKL